MRQQQELLRGTVNAVVFYNAENGYCVLRLQCEDGELTNVVGMIPMPVVGERLLITGHWVSHNTYGRQFEAEFLERREIEAYLASGALKGVGVKTAHRIVQLFGERALEVLEKEPEATEPVTPVAPRLIVSPLSGETVAAFSMDELAYSETLADCRRSWRCGRTGSLARSRWRCCRRTRMS